MILYRYESFQHKSESSCATVVLLVSKEHNIRNSSILSQLQTVDWGAVAVELRATGGNLERSHEVHEGTVMYVLNTTLVLDLCLGLNRRGNARA